MAVDRRTFITQAGVTLGAVACAGSAAAQEVTDGHRPITRNEWDQMIRGSSAQFTCVQTPEVTEGPFYYESSLERRALAEGRPGEPLKLRIRLGGIPPEGVCQALHGAIIDVWHTDATGLYSNVGADLQPIDTTGQTFLRGHQTTDEAGYVEFDTIVPGWEIVAAAAPVFVARRTTHIHLKAYYGRSVLTTQLFFPDELLDELYATWEPYKSHRMLSAPGLDRAYPRIRNEEDNFFRTANTLPMRVERVAGTLTAEAIIGVVGFDNRTLKPLFR